MDHEPVEGKPSKTTFVYDKKTGKVVHIHQFIPYHPDGACSDHEMEETAMKLAPLAWDRSQLGALHHGKTLEISPEHRYRIDVESHRLVVEPAPTKPVRSRRRRTSM